MDLSCLLNLVCQQAQNQVGHDRSMASQISTDFWVYEDRHPVRSSFALRSIINIELWKQEFTGIAEELCIWCFRYELSSKLLSSRNTDFLHSGCIVYVNQFLKHCVLS